MHVPLHKLLDIDYCLLKWKLFYEQSYTASTAK